MFLVLRNVKTDELSLICLMMCTIKAYNPKNRPYTEYKNKHKNSDDRNIYYDNSFGKVRESLTYEVSSKITEIHYYNFYF